MKKLILCILIFLSLHSTAFAPADIAIADITETKEVQEEIDGYWVLMEVTAYTAGPESTGKTPGHPLYGVTASQTKVKEWHTVAAGKSIPFGTKIYIPEFMDKNGGWFTVEDRGAAIGDNDLDIYMEDLEDAIEFGRKEMYVFIAKNDD